MIIINDTGGFQEISQVLKRFGKTTENARKKYREFIEEGISTTIEEDLLSNLRANNNGKQSKDSSGCWVIGDAEFQKSVLKKDAQNRVTLAHYLKQGISLNDVLKATAKETGIDARLILHQSKRTPQAKARMIFCFRARELGFPTLETGNFLGIQQAAVSNASRQGAILAKNDILDWKLK